MRCTRGTAILWALSLAFSALACTQAHISEYTPKRRDYKLPSEGKGDEAAASPGSLWHEGRPASLLFTDARALRVNDLVVVRIDEQANAQRTTDTNTTRSSTSAAKIDAFLGLLKKIPKLDPNLNVGGTSTSAFQSAGDTARTESLTATLKAIGSAWSILRSTTSTSRAWCGRSTSTRKTA